MTSTEDRFWALVDTSQGDAACWLWRGKGHKHGYGQFCLRGAYRLAHRIAYELTHGPIPPGDGPHGMCVCHSCDNPLCVNPAHLWLGTHQDNMRDRDAKGRQGGAARGEANVSAKLSNGAASALRCLRSTGHYQHRELATLFGISVSQVGRILRREARA